MTYETRTFELLKTPWLNDAAQTNSTRMGDNIVFENQFAHHFAKNSEILLKNLRLRHLIGYRKPNSLCCSSQLLSGGAVAEAFSVKPSGMSPFTMAGQHERIVPLMPGTLLIELLFAAAHFHSSNRRLLYLIDGIQEKME